MTTFLLLIDRIFDFSFRLMRSLPALAVLGIFSIVTAVISLVAVRWTSNQTAIRRVKNLIGAHVLAVRLFPDQPSVVLRAYLSLLGNTVLYLRYVLAPLLVVSLPLVLLFGQLKARFEHAPLDPGKDFLVSATFPTADSLGGAVLDLPAEFVQAAPPVRIRSEREVDWRVNARRPGIYNVRILVGGDEFSKRVVVGDGPASIVTERIRGSFWQGIADPGEPPLPATGLVELIRIQYPLRAFGVGTWKVGWLTPYAVLTLIAALLLKRVLRTEI